MRGCEISMIFTDSVLNLSTVYEPLTYCLKLSVSYLIKPYFKIIRTLYMNESVLQLWSTLLAQLNSFMMTQKNLISSVYCQVLKKAHTHLLSFLL